jgi:CDP-diacylglycerol--glycerol-3-phosphate 3-phosphatidyltransferase
MVAFRAMLGPVLALVAAWVVHPQVWLGAMIAAGFFSDVYDGILARRWGTETAALRVADTIADTLFYLSVLVAIVVRHWPVLRERILLLAVLLALEALRMVFDWIKFGRMSSYHSYAAKVWGILLATATFALLCFDRGFWLIAVAIVWGIVCDLEGLAMSAILPEWTYNVKTLRRAIALRRTMRVPA